MARIQQAGKVKIGVKFDAPGFGFQNTGFQNTEFQNTLTNQLEGFDIEISKLIAQAIFGGTIGDASSKVDFVQAVSRNREPFLQNGTVDMVIATYTINDLRKALVDFAGPYYLAHGDIMVKTGDTTIRAFADLNGKTVCIARNSTYEQSVRLQAPQAIVLPLDTYAQCTDAINDGRAQALATDNVILAGLAQASGGKYSLVGLSFTDEPYGVGIKKGDAVFATFLNGRIKEIEDSGKWRQAFGSTLGKFDLPIPQPPPIDAGSAPAAAPAATTTTVPQSTTTSF